MDRLLNLMGFGWLTEKWGQKKQRTASMTSGRQRLVFVVFFLSPFFCQPSSNPASRLKIDVTTNDAIKRREFGFLLENEDALPPHVGRQK